MSNPESTPESAPEPTSVTVLRRSLNAGPVGNLSVLDAVTWPDGPRRQVRVFLAHGTDAAQFDPDNPGGTMTLREARVVSGGVMLIGEAEAHGALTVATHDGVVDLSPLLATTDYPVFKGMNTLLALRIEEPAETVAEWLIYHARHHAADAALIISRAPTGHADFAEGLCAGLTTAGLPLRVVILESPVPLGNPALGPESHPFLAPDAPGKDRMEQPAPDAWRSPLAEHLVYEIAKWRFLAEARAVLTLDVTDILALDDQGTNAFDLCRAAEGGVVMMVGHRIYPWRIKPRQRASFGDHICRQFDARRGIARWGVAPDLAGLDNTWRAIRVSYARPDPTNTISFWRAMGIRVPGRKPSELAPKTSLIEDPVLRDLAESGFGHSPVRPPVSAAQPARPEHVKKGRTTIVTTMKNEGPFILEWLAYHRAIGVDDFLIYTNDCTDGTDTMLQLLQAKGFVQHRENPFRTMDMPPQHAALQSAESEPSIQTAGWAICMDVDEFINIKIGDGRLPTLYAAMEAAHPGANMIALTWRLFGNADIADYQDRFLTEQFTLAAPEIVRKPHQAWGFKTLFRNIDIYKKLGVHRPKGLRPDLWDQVIWLNGSGKPLPHAMFRNGWRSTTDTYGYDWVQLNHYAVRSAESFLVKRDRGRVNHVDRDQGMNYWFRMNFNMVEDRSIQRMIPAARAEFDRLLADPDISAAHDAAVAAHRVKIVELRNRADQAAFFAELTGERLQRLSRMLNIFGSAVFNAGPGVIPPDLHRQTLPKGFYFTVEHDGDAQH